jgi:oligopeptide transport system substrate-binding protein
MRNSKRKLALFCTVMLIASVFGQFVPTAAAEIPAQSLSIALGTEPETLDPVRYGGALYVGAEGGHILNNTYEGLLREVNRKLVPAIAEKYTVSSDGTVYTFTLREAKWSDGQLLTAKDFEYAWKRALDPAITADGSYYLYCLKGGQAYNEGSGKVEDVGVTALDNKTLKVTLTAPMPHFLSLTTYHNFMPVRKDMVEEGGEDWSKNPETAISDGPFKLVEYTAGKQIVIEKNVNYWNASNVRLNKITAVFGDDEAAAVKAYSENKIDMLDLIAFDSIPSLKAKFPEFKILTEHSTFYYAFNTEKVPMNNIKVRKALSLAIDRDAITARFAKPGQNPAGGLIPMGFKDSQGREIRKVAGEYGLIQNTSRVKEAQKLLAEAGYPGGKKFPVITILLNKSPEHEAIAKAVQAMWKQNLGIEAKVVCKESKDYRADIGKGDFYIARSGWGADYPDPMTFLELWTSNAYYNDAHWKNAEYDKLIAAASKVNGKERDHLIYKAEKMLIDNAVIAPLYYLTDPILVKNHVKGWEKCILSYLWFGSSYVAK